MSDQNTGVSTASRTTSGQQIPQQTSVRSTSAGAYEPAPTGWVGWIAFAGIMMMMLGCFHAIQGLVAIFQDKYFLVGSNQLVVHVDYTTWGWVHLIGGIIVAGAGAALLAGQMWARVIAVICAFASALLNIAFLSAYPIWSTIMIAVDVLVIWAVTVHGREMRKTDSGY